MHDSIMFVFLQATPALTTLQLIHVADHMTSSRDLRLLAAHLGINHNLVESELNSSKSTPEAACNVLFDWRNTVATGEEAYRVLKAALMTCGNRQVVTQVLDA